MLQSTPPTSLSSQLLKAMEIQCRLLKFNSCTFCSRFGGDAIIRAGDAVHLGIHTPDNAVVTPSPDADEDGWIHAAFVYDGGTTDTGRIYLNGVLDWEGAKRAANGGGHLIIGGRNNGERNYTGLIDEVLSGTLL